MRDQERVDLLARPEWLRLEDGGLRKLINLSRVSELWHPHEELHGFLVIDKRVPLSHKHGAEQAVLYDPHDWLVALWGDDLPRYSHELSNLSQRLV